MSVAQAIVTAIVISVIVGFFAYVVGWNEGHRRGKDKICENVCVAEKWDTGRGVVSSAECECEMNRTVGRAALGRDP